MCLVPTNAVFTITFYATFYAVLFRGHFNILKLPSYGIGPGCSPFLYHSHPNPNLNSNTNPSNSHVVQKWTSPLDPGCLNNYRNKQPSGYCL